MNNDLSVIEKKVAPVVTEAQSMIVASHEDMEVAAHKVVLFKALKREIQEFFSPMKEAAWNAHKKVCEQEKMMLQPITSAIVIAESRINDFVVADQRRKDQIKREADERAAKDREKEIGKIQKTLNVILEKFKTNEEKIKELQLIINNPELSDLELEIYQTQLNTLLEKSNTYQERISQKSAAITSMAGAPAPAAVPAQSKIKGVNTKTEKIPEISNPYALTQAVANRQVPLSVLAWDMAKIKRLVNDGMDLPGVSTTETTITKVRAGRV